jgi:hypothetical protein
MKEYRLPQQWKNKAKQTQSNPILSAGLGITTYWWMGTAGAVGLFACAIFVVFW